MVEVNGWLDTDLGIDIWNRKYRHNNETLDQWLDRVSGKNPEIKRLIKEKKFMFGGRTTANRGVDNNSSFSNCYTEGRVDDSMRSIMETASNLALTYKSQGGEGLSVTNIRPKNTPIGESGFVSDGFIPFMKIFDTTTDAISQGGSRKGALLMSCDVMHKDIMDFIKVKSDTDAITKANLSVEINDEFMNAVDDYYETGKKNILQVKREYGGHVVEYEICPIEIYKVIMEYAYNFADPGVILMTEFQNYNLMEHVDKYVINCSNACGEQPMPKYSSCNLSSFNLSEYVRNDEFDFVAFKNDIPTVVEAMDDVLDEGADRHPLLQQREAVRKYRNIGIGIMGLGTLFIKLKIEYGSEESKELLSEIMTTLFKESVKASSEIASKKGSFELYDERVFDSRIIRNHFSEEEIEVFKKQGLRGTSLISCAPTGSIGTMLGISTGIEPYFAFKYFRKTESLHGDKDKTYTIYDPIAKEYLNNNKSSELPDYFVSSESIPWKDRLDIQSIAQFSTDTAISSTVNLPKETTLEEVEQLYLYAWKKKLKGITIFYSGGKKSGVLSTTDDFQDDIVVLENNEIPRGYILDSSDDLIGRKIKLQTGCGSLHISVFFDELTGEPMEIYLNKGGTGGCMGYSGGLSRMVSLALRGGIHYEEIVEQLKSVHSCPSYVVRSKTKGDTSKGNNCSSAVGFALENMIHEIQMDLGIKEEHEKVHIKPKVVQLGISKKDTENYDKCPECGENTLVGTGGCESCLSCGFSKC